MLVTIYIYRCNEMTNKRNSRTSPDVTVVFQKYHTVLFYLINLQVAYNILLSIIHST